MSKTVMFIHGASLTPASFDLLRTRYEARGYNCVALAWPLEDRTVDVIRAQMEGEIGYGFAAALDGAITLKEGRVEQSNFHDYRVLRMNEMPKVEVHIVPSQENPTGVGEPGVPPIAPAVCNALFNLTGKRIRTLPIGSQRKA